MCKAEGRAKSYGVFCTPHYACARQRVELSLMECFVTTLCMCKAEGRAKSYGVFCNHTMHVQGRG